MATTPLSLEQFGQTIKAKHPEYADMADADVASKVLAKYPQYKDMVQTAAPAGQTAPPQQQGFLESLGHTFGIGTQEAEQRKQDLTQHPIRTILQDQPPVQAAQAIYQGGKRILGELGQAGSAAMQGNAPGMAQHAIQALPFVGAGIQRGAEQLPAQQGVQNPFQPGVLGTVAGTASQAAPMVLGAADNAFPGRGNVPTPNPVDAVQRYLRPTSSPSIVSRTEFAARKLSAAILPADKDASNFIKAAQEEMPNVLDYAKRTGNPLQTQLEFSKAAQGYAQEMLNLKNSIEAPVQNKVVKTTGSGFGSRMQEGPDTYSTVAEIDRRITAINDELRAPRLNAGDTRAALAGNQDIQLEASRLRTILHRELADASGLTPAQVEEIRQRAGRSYELANDADAAVTKRMQAVGQADMRPIKTSELPSRALNYVRGSQVNVADRAFQRAISSFPGEMKPAPMPSPMPSAPADRMMDLLQQSKQRRLDSLLRP